MTARRTNKGLVYLRRSSGKQETSLQTQIEWAIIKAKELRVIVEGDWDDLKHMQANKLHSWKSIRLDDAITGADLDRPGFLAIKRDVEKDKSVSHIFTYRRDRLARPEDAMMMGAIEKDIRQLGVSLVLFEKTVGPRERGRADIGDDIGMLFEYYESGEFLKKHAERIIASKILLTKGGFWSGGRAPYGFTRALVDVNGRVIEELADGRHVRQQGCHVRILPKDEAKLATWCLILDMKHSGLGGKRIATRLNELGIPSPDAGRIRTDQGVKHFVSGKWYANTVLDLCRNGLIIGSIQLGKRSDGAHRRLSPDGPRLLTNSDRSPDGTPRVVMNDPSDTIVGKTGIEPRYDEIKWFEIQAQLKHRSKSQRGIPRAKDPDRYPLATRIIDLTDGCGSIMYAKSSGKKRLYACGRYMASSGAECKHNSVDAEAILTFVLQKLRSIVLQENMRDDVIKRIETQVSSGAPTEPQAAKEDLKKLESGRHEILGLIANTERRMASESNDERYEAIARQFDQFKSELRILDATIAVRQKQSEVITDDGIVDGGVQIFDYVKAIVESEKPRCEITKMFRQIGLRIGLDFVARRQGDCRILRVVESGIITFGERDLPVPIHGKYGIVPAGNSAGSASESVVQSELSVNAQRGVCNESSKELLESASVEHLNSRPKNKLFTMALSESPRLSKTPVFPRNTGVFSFSSRQRKSAKNFSFTARVNTASPASNGVDLRKLIAEAA